MDEDKSNKDILLFDIDEGEGKPQEIEDIEKRYNDAKNSLDEKDIKTTDKGEKEFNTNVLLLNCYWIELLSKISLTTYLIIYEIIIYLIISSFLQLINGNIDNVKNMLILVFNQIGLKWLFVVSIAQHLSIGFFCLTNFSKVLKEKDKPLKFIISNIIKSILFYLVSIFIMRNMIRDGLFGAIIDEINKIEISKEGKDMILHVIEDLKKIVIRYIGNLLGNYNNYLEQLLIYSLYITLFKTPKSAQSNLKIFTRLLSILPISYIIISFVFRALNNLGKITLSLYVIPIFVGNKFTIFGFFIAFLLYLKIKDKNYKMFDEEGHILPNVFAKISSKIFSFFGFIELYIGLFHSELLTYGIGSYYLLILCAPIMTLYDYKKDYEIHIKPCKKINLGKFINFVSSIFLYGIVFLLGFIIFAFAMGTFVKYIKPLVEFIINNFENIIQIFDMLYTSLS